MFLSRVQAAQHDVEHEVHRVKPKHQILHELNEYLFDVFDANCMEDFKILEDFERKALPSFDNDKEEFSMEQYRLHAEFLRLFEGLIEKFLAAHGYSNDKLYEELSKHYNSIKEVERHGEKASDAHEVVDVIAFYSDFQSWASMMRENIKIRKKYKTFLDKMLTAVAADAGDVALSSHK